MFDPSSKPRVFAVPPGADFPAAIARELIRAYNEQPPEALAKVQVFVNAGRMRRRIVDALRDGAPRLLPRVSLVSDLAPLVPEAPLPPTRSALERTLEMARLLTPLLASPEAPAPRSAVFDLADSLIALLDEMHTESVSAETLLQLDIEGTPRHWEQTSAFIAIVDKYLAATREDMLDPVARQREALAWLLEKWTVAPPKTPVLVVGSTGSRGTTFELMRAVAQLPLGAVILPGFDFDMPAPVWDRLRKDDTPAEDHPQYRFATFLAACGLEPSDVGKWPVETPDPRRTALISLSLRPAPVTNQWRTEGEMLGDLREATKNMGLILAPQPRDEANAIAVAVRDAVDQDRSVAIVTPDRTLSRRVTAALARWAIIPDDSAGMPLSLSPPGRFLRQLASMLGRPVVPGALVALLRHPLARTGAGDRGEHTLFADALEVALRKVQLPVVSAEIVSKTGENTPQGLEWVEWITEILGSIDVPAVATLAEHAARLLAIAEAVSGGGGGSAGELWEKEAGEKARDVMATFCTVAPDAQTITLADFRRLLDHQLSSVNVRAGDGSRPDVLILGTLEARTQGADLVILGGLNDGIWPASSGFDPWLSRRMRRDAGLMSPERQIGLSAHDYQQSVCAKHVILSRSKRDEEAETIPSRWLNRLTNLLQGLPEQGGAVALEDMTTRGARYLHLSYALDKPSAAIAPAVRPAPAPPKAVRPKKLSVTEVEKLIRDPFWIYAKHILRLRPLNQLAAQASPALRGDVFHKIAERFVDGIRVAEREISAEHFLEVSRVVLDELVSWPATRELWMGQLSAIADGFVAAEIARNSEAKNLGTEIRGHYRMTTPDFVITGEADRMDATADGSLKIYDYKSSSTIPTHKQAKLFNPQILIEAVMAEAGAFTDIAAAEVKESAYLSLSRGLKETLVPMQEYVITHGEHRGDTLDFRVETIRSELAELLMAYTQDNLGYAARRAMEKVRYEGDYDHLARFGEWDDADPAENIPVR